MNIKQAAEQSGVSSQNIRFYETEGLVVPARRGNGYRDYSAKDVHDLKLIRMLRMLEMPLPQIRQVLQGELALPDAAQTQRILLEQRAQQLAGAIQFCSQLQKNSQSLAALDVDQCLARMQTPDRQGGFFTGWLEDWQAVALAEHERTFSFIPDTSVQNPQEFTTALEAYAAENGLTLEMLQEGMTPRFLLDGLEYKAACYYGGGGDSARADPPRVSLPRSSAAPQTSPSFWTRRSLPAEPDFCRQPTGCCCRVQWHWAFYCCCSWGVRS